MIRLMVMIICVLSDSDASIFKGIKNTPVYDVIKVWITWREYHSDTRKIRKRKQAGTILCERMNNCIW